MALSIDDHVKQLVPSWLYYPHKIAQLARKSEPELRILRDLAPAGRVALDIGANRGLYSYALAKIASRVEAFEPNPELARFARRKLGSTVRVHDVALSDHAGTETLFIPQAKPGIDVHYNASLKKVYDFDTYVEITVPVRTLDSFGFRDVGFIKIDAEGSDMEVIAGGRRTITESRPTMVVEIVALTHSDPLGCVALIEDTLGYQGRILIGDRLVDARKALVEQARGEDHCNVVFTPQ